MSAEDIQPLRPAGLGPPAVARVSSSELFRGEREIVIAHHGREYRLFITRADKLILTK
ncbi:MAG TPA: hemin uptake protein HemP [Methylomirabilota bacterium]|jgi:hemin uptake protein HemP